MASTTCSSLSLIPKQSNRHRTYRFSPKLCCPISSFRFPKLHASTNASSPPSSSPSADQMPKEEAVTTDVLKRFIELNLGKWNGTFHQFDPLGNLLQKVNTKLAVSSYGENELISLIQTLYIRQPLSRTSISESDDEPEWAEYKIKETNMFTVDKYQQFADWFFPQ